MIRDTHTTAGQRLVIDIFFRPWRSKSMARPLVRTLILTFSCMMVMSASARWALFSLSLCNVRRAFLDGGSVVIYRKQYKGDFVQDTHGRGETNGPKKRTRIIRTYHCIPCLTPEEPAVGGRADDDDARLPPPARS